MNEKLEEMLREFMDPKITINNDNEFINAIKTYLLELDDLELYEIDGGTYWIHDKYKTIDNPSKINDLLIAFLQDATVAARNKAGIRVGDIIWQLYIDEYTLYDDALVLLQCILDDASIRDIAVNTHLVERSIKNILDKFSEISEHKSRLINECILPHINPLRHLLKTLCKIININNVFDISETNAENEIREQIFLIEHKRSSMVEDEGFWEWIKNNYPSIHDFINQPKIKKTKTNGLIIALSHHYEKRDSSNYIKRINFIFKVILKCNNKQLKHYITSFNHDWGSLYSELLWFVIFDKYFKTPSTEPKIPKSNKRVDLDLNFDGVNYLVEIYTMKNSLKNLFNMHAICELEMYFSNKRQLKELKNINHPTIYIMNVGFGTLTDMELALVKCRNEICDKLPDIAELVIVRNEEEISTYSKRNGCIVNEGTELSRKLKEAFKSHIESHG